MNSHEANRILGDLRESAPDKWEYGKDGQPELHVLVMLYAATGKKLQSLHEKVFWSTEFSDGLCIIKTQDSVIAPGDETEPFGFRDGISQPPIQGLLGRRKPAEYPINTGEFVLGYDNELDLLTQIPSIDNWADPRGDLADHPAFPGKRRAFGLNGTYLVFRKLVQNVDEFWAYIDKMSKTHDFKAYFDKTSKDSSDRVDVREFIAAKMVGRWRSGAPLVLSPDSPGAEPRNDFLFMDTDPDGVACPIGSHIRRAHPRDSLDMPPSRSLLVSRRHRLVRRARKYSVPLTAEDNSKCEQGLYFITLNADLRRQYEFVQQLWINDPSFNGLDRDRDPLVGDNSDKGEFTIQAKPINHHLRELPRFVVMKGGGYFFLPGIRAIRFLANYKP
jgi:Dyp-type peroxidase family